MITQALLNQIKHLIRPVQTRLANSIARAVIKNVGDATKMQMLQLGVLGEETVDDCERFQGFGFNSVPLPGAEAVVLFPNGDRGHPLVVAIDDRRYRPTDWTEGEAGTYNAFDAQMRHKADGTTEVTGGGVALPLATLADLQSLVTIFSTMAPIGGDGGAALKAALIAWAPTGTTKLKGE